MSTRNRSKSKSGKEKMSEQERKWISSGYDIVKNSKIVPPVHTSSGCRFGYAKKES